MAALKRLQKLAGIQINESVSADPIVNDRIEKQLRHYDRQMQIALSDSFELINMARDKGVSEVELAYHLSLLHPNGYDFKEILSTIKRDFKWIIRIEGKFLIWDEDDLYDVPPEERELAAFVNNIAWNTREIAEKLGEFTIKQLITEVMKKMNLSSAYLSTVAAKIHHFLETFKAEFRNLGGDRWRFVPTVKPSTADTMKLFKDIVSKKYR